MHGLLEHQSVTQVVDVLASAGKMCELKHLEWRYDMVGQERDPQEGEDGRLGKRGFRSPSDRQQKPNSETKQAQLRNEPDLAKVSGRLPYPLP